MKMIHEAFTVTRRTKAMALVMVITVVALMSILIVAIFSLTRTEYKATQAYVSGKTAKQFSDIGVAIVQAQIQNAQNTLTSANRTTHATQPGMVRVYEADGDFSAAYKLYSSSQMKVTGDENNLYGDMHVPPANWDTLPARYVDLNEPVIRPGLLAGTNAVYFPILDPRAAWNYGSGGQDAGKDGKTGTTQVEGFSYEKTGESVGNANGQDYSNQVVTPSDTSDPDNLRLPMPVEWLYVLEDGTIGALDSDNRFVSSSASNASPANPIVGRIAFWADDESCKININTASEPTYMSSPFYYHQRDSKWAHFPAVTGEYQRYPGHPATVALSAVLAPNYLLDPLLPNLDGFSNTMDVVNFKEQIYELAPKIAGGGSEAGTRPFVRDDLSDQNGERNAASKVDLTSATQERLFASVDEMLFKDLIYDGQKGRSAAVLSLPGGRNMFDHDVLEKSRFFLTAHSRSPEFNIHGLPRICMWPVADESLGEKYRTTFDNMIALCATIKKSSSSEASARSYYFRRKNSRSGSDDLNISRNGRLLDYLVDQMSQHVWPATAYSSSSRNADFSKKYGSDNVNQLAVQFFDYIRSTNLYDGIMARGNDGWSVRSKSTAEKYTYGETPRNYFTYTAPRITPSPTSVDVSGDSARNNQATSERGMVPGHGQVSPAVWSKGGRSYKGFGRMITISEIGFQFLCTADGSGTSQLNTFPSALAYGRGGGSAARFGVNPNEGVISNAAAYPNMNVGAGNAVWWSNFPPLSSNPSQDEIATYMSVYGCQAGGRSANANLHPSKHPGFNPANWNMTLPRGVWLTPNQKRIQVMLLLEAFCPSLGFTGLYPEFTIVLDGTTIGQMTLNGQRLFSTTGDIPIKSNNNIFDNANGAHVVGGHASPSAIAGGRHTRQISNGGGTVLMAKDVSYDTNNTSGHNALSNYAFCSDFVTVDRNASLNVSFPGGDVKVQIYDTHNWESAQPVQTLYVNFSKLPSQLPVPNLPQSLPYSESIDSLGRINYTRSRQGPHYWVANYEGCIGRMSGRVNPNYGQAGQAFWQTPPVPSSPANGSDSQAGRDSQSLRGRLSTEASLFLETRSNVTANGVSVIAPDQTDVIVSIVPTMGDYRTLAAMYNAPSSVWEPHPFSSVNSSFSNHSFTGFWANSEPGCKLAVSSPGATANDPSYQLIGGARFVNPQGGAPYSALHSRQADLPPKPSYIKAANAYGDFDTGISSAREGPYINKPDEGNFYAGSESRGNSTKYWRSAYFYNTWQSTDDWRSGIFMTPNRLISSPALFGSLPTGVWGSGSGGGAFSPWQTLLFRPHAHITSQEPGSERTHPGMQDPSDHYLLDLFFMPVVEPYAISEPLSIAGRINMNYQIMPFTNIRRATGMHALMKGEYVTAIPNNHIVAAKEYYPGQAVWNERFWDDKTDNRYWHRSIDAKATLRQFDLKFSHKSGGSENSQGLFRSASQICEMHLIPRRMGGSGTIDVPDVSKASSQDVINNAMNSFWGSNRPTGDNVRERPYANLYARLTTRSNTFRVHVRAQVFKKARSTAADVVDPVKDGVVSEYRGSTLIERFIDPNDTEVVIPDYAVAGINQAPLEKFYRFRVLETKRFNP